MRSKKLERIIFCHTFAASINDNAISILLPHQPDSERPSGFILRKKNIIYNLKYTHNYGNNDY